MFISAVSKMVAQDSKLSSYLKSMDLAWCIVHLTQGAEWGAM
jgi:hypothetical protein